VCVGDTIQGVSVVRIQCEGLPKLRPRQVVVPRIAVIGEQKVAAGELTFEKAVKFIESIANDLKQPLERLTPQKATIKFGLELGIESGGLTAIIVKGTTTAGGSSRTATPCAFADPSCRHPSCIFA